MQISTCIASSALQKTTRDNESDFGRDVCKVVSNKLNVNDGWFSVPTTEQAVEMSLRLIKLLQRGSFRLTMFFSNVKIVLSVIPPEERIVKIMNLNQLFFYRALGLQWDTETNTLKR